MKAIVLAKGIATFFVPQHCYNRVTGGASLARYCYSVFLHHLYILQKAGYDTCPQTVGELGPGDSVGAGLAALIAGAEHYYGLDLRPYAVSDRNLAIFDELVELFRRRTPVPDAREFPSIKPHLEDHGFPADILTPERMARALEPDRLVKIRRSLQSSDGGAEPVITYLAPWHEEANIKPGSLDWLFSQTVLEHVDDLDLVYRMCHRWLKSGGAMTHEIDFTSHGLTREWNGHYGYSDAAWLLARGARTWFLNRQPPSAHRSLVQKQGFDIILDLPSRQSDGLARNHLARRFAGLSDEDLSTCDLLLVARKH